VHYPSSSFVYGAGAYSKHFADVFSFCSNPAALGNTTVGAVGVANELKFLLDAPGSYTIAASLPISLGGIGINCNHSGFDVYKETRAGLAYGKCLGPVAIGAQFNYTSISIAGYGKVSVIHFDLGTIWQVSEKLYSGIRIKNPIGGKFGSIGNEKLAFDYTIGLGYEASESVFISTEIIKEEDRSVNVLLSLNYRLDNKFYLRGGISTATTSPWLSGGLAWKNIRVDITSSFHPQLGITPGLSLIYSAIKHQ